MMHTFKHAHSTLNFGPLKGSSTADLYKLCVPLMILTTFFVGLRVYVRGFMTRTFSWDDWLILPAYAMFIAICTFAITIAQWVESETAAQRFPGILKLVVAGSVLFIIDQVFIKLSVAAYFCRICGRWQRYVIVFSVAIFAMFYTVLLFVVVYQCGSPTLSNLVSKGAAGTCLSLDHIVRPILYTAVTLNAALDWIFVLATFPVLSKVRQMPKGDVTCICVLISLATGASVLSLVRIKYIPSSGQGAVLLKRNLHYSILSFCEAGIAIVTVSMATLYPLFQRLVRKGVSRCSNNSAPRQDTPQQHQPAEIKTLDSSTEEQTYVASGGGHIGVLPTIFDTENGTVCVPESPRHGGRSW